MSNIVKETVSFKTDMTKLCVENNEISKIIKSKDEKYTVRVYSDKKIGIASAIGKYDKNELFRKAKSLLDYNISYRAEPTENITKTVDLSDSLNMTDEYLIKTTSEAMNLIGKNHPEFLLSGHIKFLKTDTVLKNDRNTLLNYLDNTIDFYLEYKCKYSKDGPFYVDRKRGYNSHDFYGNLSKFCDSHAVKSEIEDGSVMPVIFLIYPPLAFRRLFGFFYRELDGEEYGEGMSAFCSKKGQKVFGENFSLYVSRDSGESYACFFDGEGTTLENDRHMFVENGIFKSPYSGKVIAKKYKLPLTSSASLNYKSLPRTEFSPVFVKSSGKTLEDLLDGRKSIIMMEDGGGLFTSKGHYSTPVILSYLYDGEKILGRLPQLSVSSNVFDMFGKDFIGVPSNTVFGGTYMQTVVTKMKVNITGTHT